MRAGFTSTEIAPTASGVTVPAPVHAAPSGDDARRGAASPRPTPLRCVVDPKTMLSAEGRSSRSTPTEIHVERRPSAVRTSVAGTDSAPEVVLTTSARRRPDAVAVPVASTTRASMPSLDWTVRAPMSTGPQRWYGDSLSHGSGRETRYGTLKPNTSAALAVLPPEVEK